MGIQVTRQKERVYREQMKTEELYKMTQVLDFGLIKSMGFFCFFYNFSEKFLGCELRRQP